MSCIKLDYARNGLMIGIKSLPDIISQTEEKPRQYNKEGDSLMRVENACTYWWAVERRAQEATSERPFRVLIAVWRKAAQAVSLSTVNGNSPHNDVEIRVILRRTTVFLSDVFRITITSDMKTKELSSDAEWRIVVKKVYFHDKCSYVICNYRH